MIKGRKRPAATDTLGLMVGAVAHPAGVSDRDGAPKVLRGALKGKCHWHFEVIKRCGAIRGFEVLPRRWVVELTDRCFDDAAV